MVWKPNNVDGKSEWRLPVSKLSGEDSLDQLLEIPSNFLTSIYTVEKEPTNYKVKIGWRKVYSLSFPTVNVEFTP